jgi:hypothetical protein
MIHKYQNNFTFMTEDMIYKYILNMYIIHTYHDAIIPLRGNPAA